MSTPLHDAFANSRYRRSATYDPAWVEANLMGPNVLWLTEALCEVLPLRPGMRVLDLGCGKAVSSVFLAREFEVQVWATDLWIPATANEERIRDAGLDAQVFPIHAEAHALPFAHGFFDAIVSMDAYHYFGTDALYLPYLAPFAKPGAPIGIVVPGLAHELDAVPPELAPHWDPAYWSFHSPAWWRRHWERSELLDVASADMVPGGWQDWLTWLEVTTPLPGHSVADEIAMLRADGGRTLGFTRVVAHRR